MLLSEVVSPQQASTDSWYVVPIGHSAANQLHVEVFNGTDRWTDGQTPDQYTDPVPHTIWAASIKINLRRSHNLDATHKTQRAKCSRTVS